MLSDHERDVQYSTAYLGAVPVGGSVVHDVFLGYQDVKRCRHAPENVLCVYGKVLPCLWRCVKFIVRVES